MSEMNEKSILDTLLKASENVPEKTVAIKRIGLSFTIKALKEGAVEQLEKKYTQVKNIKGKEEKELDAKRFNRALIAKATVAIGGDRNIKWDHPSLLSKFEASGEEAVLKKVLLSGEVSQLADVVLELSGYYDSAEEVETIKNSSEDEV